MGNNTKNSKDAFDKLVGEELFSEMGFDEMQRAESHSIAFRLFRAMDITLMVFAIAIYCLGAGLENTPLIIAGLAAYIISLFFGVLYAALTSAKGVMPEKFARKNSGASIIVLTVWSAVYLLILAGINGGSGFIWTLTFWFIYLVYQLLISFFSKRNFKVREKQLEESEDE